MQKSDQVKLVSVIAILIPLLGGLITKFFCQVKGNDRRKSDSHRIDIGMSHYLMRDKRNHFCTVCPVAVVL